MPKKILIVDDKQDLLELLAYILKQLGYEITQAFNGAEALDMMHDKNNLPDIIVCDIMMPEMDGYTFVTHLEEQEHTKNIPVIIMTAKGQTKDLFTQNQNVYDFLEKPFQPNTLKKIIEKVLAEYGKKHTQ